MKTIFITITRGGLARNILQNEFYNLIKENFVKIIILTNADKDSRFIQEFGGDNVEFIPIIENNSNFFEKILLKIYTLLVWNKNTKKMILYDTVNPKFEITRYIKYVIYKFLFYPSSKIILLKKIIRYLDFLFFQKKEVNYYRDLIKKYKPTIIFCTNISEETDVCMLKASRKEKVLGIGMPKTWDNPSKKYFRAKADKIVVWSQFMKKQMMKLQDYREEDIEIVGVPQFDYYTERKLIFSRNEFCRQTGLDPEKEIIVFGSEGKVIPHEHKIVQILLDLIKNHELIKNCQILVRPHFAYKDDYLKFKNFLGREKENIFVDTKHNHSNCFRDRWDYSKEQMNHFLNTIYHSTMIINTCSTLTLDACALSRPAILISFDGYEKLPFYKSTARWYISDYYSQILKFEAAPLVGNIEELKNMINLLLNNPDYKKNERQKLLDYFCHKIDGQSGKRLYHFINNYV